MERIVAGESDGLSEKTEEHPGPGGTQRRRWYPARGDQGGPPERYNEQTAVGSFNQPQLPQTGQLTHKLHLLKIKVFLKINT